jgi:hypothetical protein
LKALARHCACEGAADDVRRSSCPSHALLLDQRSIDRLLFARRIADRLRREELLVAA